MPDLRVTVSNQNRPLVHSSPVFPALAAALVLSILSGCQSSAGTPSNPQNLLSSQERALDISKVTTVQGAGWSDWSARMRPLFSQARILVEEHTGENLSSVTLNIANDNTITSQFDNRHFASQFLNSVMDGQKGTYAALYATRKGEVMVSQSLMQSYQRSLPNDAGIQESAMLALLIHELVHAADDQRYQIHENRDLNFRASFAQSAAFEGHAQFVTRSICATAGCLSGLEALDEFMFGFISDLAKRPNGEKLIGDLLSNPPQDPIQILDPASYPNTQREKRNQQLIAASTNLNHPWLSAPWASVQTSPLKGVNLRTDPARRNAAVDGFTRLITSMVALQLYNQSEPGSAPIDLTVIRADSNKTAELFGQTLHNNTQASGAQLSRSDELVKVAGEAKPAMLYMTKEPAENQQTYFTLVGVSGLHVVQISGLGQNESLFVSYIDQLLTKLSDQYGASL